MRSPPWNDTENKALVALYFVMLDSATIGKPYNKAAMIRVTQNGIGPRDLSHENCTTFCGLTGKLADRSKGSIEAKLMNASAAHRDLGGVPTMADFGYVPLANYQATLKVAMREELQRRDNQFVAEQLA